MFFTIQSTALFVFAIFTILFLETSNAASVKPKFLKLDVEHVRANNNDTSLIKRGMGRTSLNDRHSYYTANVKVGSTKQSMDLLIDSGSSDMFVVDSAACPTACNNFKTFKKSLSKTFQSLKTKFVVYYGSGKASGTWAKDSVTVGSVTIPKQQFAVADIFPTNFGSLGIGFSPDVAKLNVQYPNFPKSLKNAGIIGRVSYSFYAGNYGSNRGHLLFGAVDLAKVSGKLVKINMVNTTPRSPTIPLNGISIDSKYAPVKSKVLSTQSVNILIDTGTSMTLIPQQAFQSLLTSLKATKCIYGYCVDCSMINKNINIDFKFPGITIKSPLSDLVYQNSATKCMLGVQGSSNMFILGADAIRAAYIVFDMEGFAIHLGTANKAATNEKIRVITNTIPNN